MLKMTSITKSSMMKSFALRYLTADAIDDRPAIAGRSPFTTVPHRVRRPEV